MNKELTEAWEQRKKLYAEGRKLWRKGNKICAEGYKICAEGYKLCDKGDKFFNKGNELWEDAITAVYGKNYKIEWEDNRCILPDIENKTQNIIFE